MAKKKPRITLTDVLISGYAAEGKSIAKIDGKVIFITGAVPGDVADVLITKSKKDWAEGRAVEIKTPSANRVEPFCIHFGTCGGCKWQMLPYDQQLQYKQQETEDNLRKISKTSIPPLLPIVGCDSTVFYRNKLEFTFSNKRFLTSEEMNKTEIQIQQNALGYHVAGLFDKVLDISECWLMDGINNKLRNSIRDYALKNELEFYDIRNHTGWLRNIIIRNCSTGELMVNICLNYEDEPGRISLLDFILKSVPEITTLLYTINPKFNDSIYDLEPQVYFGKGFVTEVLEGLKFIISPKSFFQTNTRQAEKLYSITRDFAELKGNETLYDLYCGTGSIGIYLSRYVSKVIGVEVIDDAIKDAKKNAELNNITHTHFFAGDVIKICTNNFFEIHGRPDVIITDPPRAGMHEKLINKLLEIEAPKIVYVSCNPATQARDIGLLSEKYYVEKVQPVDMFPHTHHIESVALLKLRNSQIQIN
ncbi:MAG: 23S rRNA (uracil(1939)-C(5))-methyltransferase RlmD [Bacteroidetes bacterium]|nr:23S rRNA (uracil(1939)-C(5))-methyltransferase RlmD [Bacteroidota bacterium]